MDIIQERFFALLVAIPALISGLTVHEFAHAWMANRLGDDHAKRQGRLTLDPLAHLDPVGTIFIVLAWLSGFLVGWARPVPIDVRALPHPRRDSMWIALAGPISNMLQAPVWLLLLAIYSFAARRAGWVSDPFQFWDGFEKPMTLFSQPPVLIGAVLMYGVIINVGMAAFNMIPFPPLDGHWVLQALGPPFIQQFYDAIRPYSFILLLVLINVRMSDGESLLNRAVEPAYIVAYRAIDFALTGNLTGV